MTEKEALLWVLGILGSLFATVITIDKVLDIIDEVNRLTLEAVRALLEAQLTGNNVPAMQASKEKIDNYLMEGVTKHGSNA